MSFGIHHQTSLPVEFLLDPIDHDPTGIMGFLINYLALNMRPKHITIALALFASGVLCGGYIFSRSIPRSFLAIGSCGDHCYKPNEVAGLITSAAILRAPSFVPGVVLESDKCLAIRYPKPEARVHYVLFPKHDTRDITTLTEEDVPYVLGCFALARELVARENLKDYRLVTNGPNLQDIAYLHFHLIGR